MGQKFAAYDTDPGPIVGFYDDVDSPVPSGVKAIPITDAEWTRCLQEQGWTIANGTLFAPPALTLAQAKSLQNDQIIASAQLALQQVVSAYPDLEVATWPQQLTEATAYTASNTAATPMLSSIATASGDTVAALAANVISKASTFQSASGAVVGKRVKLMKQIAAATTVAAVQAIVW